MNTSGYHGGAAGAGPEPGESVYIEKVDPGVESHFLEASDGRVGFAVGDGVNHSSSIRPVRASGEFTQAVLQVTDVRAVSKR